MKTILLHGLGQTSADWSEVMECLELENKNREARTDQEKTKRCSHSSASNPNQSADHDEGMMDAICPDLFALTGKPFRNYDEMFLAFVEYCSQFEGKVNLCGLSMGGLLALDYVKQFPDKVGSVVLIGVPYHIPKKLLAAQNALFHLLPKSVFKKIEMDKADFIRFSKSMTNIDVISGLDAIENRCLVVCGSKDVVNAKSAMQLYEALENSQIEIIEDSGHEVNQDQPDILAKVVFSFLRADSSQAPQH